MWTGGVHMSNVFSCGNKQDSIAVHRHPSQVHPWQSANLGQSANCLEGPWRGSATYESFLTPPVLIMLTTARTAKGFDIFLQPWTSRQHSESFSSNRIFNLFHIESVTLPITAESPRASWQVSVINKVLCMLPHHQHIKLFDCTQFVFHNKCSLPFISLMALRIGSPDMARVHLQL